MSDGYACLSEDGKYRYWLTRRWGPSMRSVVFVMLNPSTADATVDDPTIIRCRNFAQDWGYDALHVVNLCAFRATDPKVMRRAWNPVGRENDEHLHRAADLVRWHDGLLVAAWGANADQRRVHEAIDALGVVEIHHLGLTKGGHPRHPLYLRRDAKPVLWNPFDGQGDTP